MEALRRILGSLFTMLGAYYCVLSTFTLVRLPSLTWSWIERSGDPDFKYDYGLFMTLTAFFTILVGVFGIVTAAKGFAAARGRRESWLLLALTAPVLHFLWFMYRVIGSGVRDRAAMEIFLRNNAIRFGGICVAFIVMWIITRDRHATRPADTTFVFPSRAQG